MGVVFFLVAIMFENVKAVPQNLVEAALTMGAKSAKYNFASYTEVDHRV